jgi:predicted nucleotide-binding protein
VPLVWPAGCYYEAQDRLLVVAARPSDRASHGASVCAIRASGLVRVAVARYRLLGSRCQEADETTKESEGKLASRLEHLSSLLDQIDRLPHRDDHELDALKKRVEMIVRNVFGETSKYLKDLSNISFYPMVYPADESYSESSWNSGVASLRNLIHTMMEELELFGATVAPPAYDPDVAAIDSADRVFVVHGHDEAAKSKVARFVERLGLTAIILHERADGGKTIIEKFEHESAAASFAVVLLTGDDIVAVRNSNAEALPRARQNVVFELGYFVGRLGRARVVALREPGVEMPSDYAGVVYIELDGADAWRLSLAREMKNAGLSVDMNKAI